MDAAAVMIRHRRSRVRTRVHIEDVFPSKNMGDSNLWHRVTTEPSFMQRMESMGSGRSVSQDGKDSERLLDSTPLSPLPFQRVVSEMETMEEDLVKALDDLEVEAHQSRLRRRSRMFQCLWRVVGIQPSQPEPQGWQGSRLPSRQLGAVPGSQFSSMDSLPGVHGEPVDFSLHCAKEHLIGVLHNALNYAKAHQGQEGITLLAQQANICLAAVANADGPRAILRAVREIRRIVPFEVDPLEDMPLLAAYMCSLRIRWAYFLMFALITALAFFTGQITELFFTVFAEEFALHDAALHRRLQVWLYLWMLPFAVMLLALIGDEMSDLALDAFDRPPLIWTLALVLAAMQRDRKWAPDMFTCKVVDACVLVLVEGLPLACAVQGHLADVGFWHGYMQGGLFAAFIASAIALGADLAICAQDVTDMEKKKKTSPAVHQFHPAHQALRHIYYVLDKHKIFPGTLSSRYALFRAHFEQVSDPPTGGRAMLWQGMQIPLEAWTALLIFVRDLPALLARPQNRLVSITLLSWTGVSSLIISHVALPMVAASAMLVATIVILSATITTRYPQVVGPFYNVVLLFFLVASVGIEVGTTFYTSADHITPLMTWPTWFRKVPAEGGHLPQMWFGNSSMQASYPACHFSWGSPNAPLSSLDLAALSWIAYEPDCGAIQRLLRESFGRRPWVERCSPYEALPRLVVFYFPPGPLGREGTRVFALKGTSTWLDIYTDTKLYATIQVLQAFSRVVPILSLLPLPLVQNIVGKGGRETSLWSELEDVIASMTLGSRDKVVLTGHSLGGVFAQIVATRQQLPAIAFSSPGIVYSAQRFDLAVERATHIVVVAPENDVVSSVDKQAGVVQPISCQGPDGLPASAAVCHSLVKTACELWRVCGDHAGRDFSRSCQPHVSRALLGGAPEGKSLRLRLTPGR